MNLKERDDLIQELGPQKVKTAYLLVEMDIGDPSDETNPKTIEEVADRVGVTKKTIHEWKRKDLDFIRFKNSIVDDFMLEARGLVFKQLNKLINASQPSVKAIDIYARITGIYEDKHLIRTEDMTKSHESNDDLMKSLDNFRTIKKDKEGN